VLSSDGRDGSVYSFKPGSPDTEVTVIAPTPAADHPGAATVLPVNWWNNGEFKDQLDLQTYQFTTLAEMFARDMALPKPKEYVSPDGSLALPAYRVFQQGPPDYRACASRIRSTPTASRRPSRGSGCSSPTARRTRPIAAWSDNMGAITDLKPFADRGGESVATDGEGRVYVANGQVFVYAPDGRELGRRGHPRTPAAAGVRRPVIDKRQTLFVLTHHALYAVRSPVAGDSP
jgi:hypothetical protein